MSYIVLKSGTDIRGIASDLGGKEVNLTREAVYDITAAFVVWYTNKFSVNSADLKIAVGRDSRITGKSIVDTVIKALTDSGVTVYNCGMSSTPSMFMTTVDMKTDGAIQITASHHPFDRNGLKFFIPSGGLESEDIGEIVALADNCESVICESSGIVIPVDFMSGYSERLKRMICKGVNKTAEELPLKGLKIVVDAGNGAGGFYEKVLNDLGADTNGSQFLDPDGMFPNHIPNPEDKGAMQSICNAVLNAKADLGIIFDTDVDRAGCVGADGTEINRNRLIALSSYIACDGKKDAVIVTDSVTSDGLKTFIEEDLGCKHYRYRRGYKNVINKAIELTEKGEFCPLAIETSGHAALAENYFLDDGAYLVTKIVIELAKGKKLEKITETLKTPVEEREVRFNIKAEDFKSYGQMVIDKLNEFALLKPEFKVADDNREGIRVSTENGWFLLRLSVHDPVMPMNFESDVVGGIDKDIAAIKDFFTQFEELDISAL
ncbi:MAG: phosphomannomutase/phosphoglucomutase [Clostridia bacterium]|nr:phosphomannomutase/phosphoglucomutase [Clostridia bacterium]